MHVKYYVLMYYTFIPLNNNVSIKIKLTTILSAFDTIVF